MEDINNSSGDEIPKNLNLVPQEQQTEIQYLNEDYYTILEAIDETANISNQAKSADFAERYNGVAQLDLLANDEEIRNLIEVFYPESLLNLQNIGINILNLATNGILNLLSLLLPVKVQIHPPGLSDPLILLIVPHLMEEGHIHLTCIPYAKHIPPIPLTEGQSEAINSTNPFFMIRRVVDPVQSPLFENKQNELWDTLTLTVSIKKKQFKELMEVIKFQPLGVEKWVLNQFWTEDQLKKVLRIIDMSFPLQLGLFTGLHCLFYPLNQLSRFPHLQDYVQKRLLELS
jgi:hypothetical protein